MFRFETLVRYLMVSALGFSVSLHAEDSRAPLPDATAKRYEEKLKEFDCDGPGRKKNLQNCLRYERPLGMIRSTGKDSAETCDEAKDEFNKSRQTFESACQSLGIPTSGGPEGSIACSWHKERCNCLKKGFEDPDDIYQCSEVKGASNSSKQNPLTSHLGLIDLRSAEKRIRFCPAENADDTERYEAQLEKAQERVKDLKKKLPEILTKGNEAQDQFTEKQNDASRKATELQQQFAKEMNDIKRKKEESEQQAVAQMAQIRGEIDKIDAQIRSMELNKIDAEVKLSEAKTQIELNCHATASAQVQKLQADQMAKIGAKMPRGGFHSMMKNVGVSDREAWEKRADIYYKRCLISRPTRDSKQAAQNIYESTLRQIDSAISSARQGRYRQEESLNQIMSTNGCAPAAAPAGGVSNESQMCRSMRQAQEEMAMAQQNAFQQQQMIQQESAAAQRQLAQKNQTLQMEYADAQRELTDETARMENLRSYLDLKRQHSSGAASAEAAKELGSSSSKLKGAAIQYSACCADAGNTDGLCKEVNDFILSWGGRPSEIGLKTPSELDMSPDEEPSSTRTAPSQIQITPESTTKGSGIKESGWRLDDR